MNHLIINIAVVGAISSGKSTLVNALYGNITANTGMGITTYMLNERKYIGSHILKNENITINLIDTSSEPGLNNIANSARILDCHIVICVIDMLDFARSDTNTINIFRILSAMKPNVHQKIIFVVNKGDIHSSEYIKLYERLIDTMKLYNFVNCYIIKMNVASACLANYTGDYQNTEQLLRLVNSLYTPFITDIKHINQTMIQSLAERCTNNGYSILINTINKIIATESHLMCLSNAVYDYKKQNRSMSYNLTHYDDLKLICKTLDVEFNNSYSEHITTSRCNIQ